MLKVANKTILEYNLETLGDIDEIIFVVGYKKDMIKKFVSENYPKLHVRYIEQKEQLGTGHAVSILSNYIKSRFILMLGDNIYSKTDINKISKHKYSILVKKTKNWENFGVIKEKNNIVKDIIEKPKEFVSDLISCGLFSLDNEIFGLLEKIKKSKRGEYELTDALKTLSQKEKIHCARSIQCFQISHPWDLLAADQEIRKSMKIKDTRKIKDFPVNKNLIGKNSKINGKAEN